MERLGASLLNYDMTRSALYGMPHHSYEGRLVGSTGVACGTTFGRTLIISGRRISAIKKSMARMRHPGRAGERRALGGRGGDEKWHWQVPTIHRVSPSITM